MIVEMSKVLPKHQITIPKEVRESLQLEIGDRIIFVETEDGFVVRKMTPTLIESIRNSAELIK